MALANASALFRKWLWLWRNEGLTTALKAGFLFLRGFLFRYQTYYLYRIVLDSNLDEVGLKPKIDNFTLEVVSSNKQAGELMARGFGFGSFVISGDRKLARGAVAVCAFVGQKLAHISWVAMTQAAKDSIDDLPCPIDFSQEAYLGGVWTNPEYRRKGLMTYGAFRSFQFLREKGIITTIAVVANWNVAPQGGFAKFAPSIYAQARYLRVLGWKSWRETPLHRLIGRRFSKMALAGTKALFRKWLWLWRNEGSAAALKAGFLFLMRSLFRYQTYYLYRVKLDNSRDEVEFKPKMDNFTLKIISSNKQAGELMARGFDFGSFVMKGERKLERGAVAICAFVEQKLTHISWVAMTQAAKDSIDGLPCPVDFSKEAYSGGTIRNPKYRRWANFSMAFVFFKAMQFAWRSDKTVFRFVVRKSNRVAQNGLARKIGAWPCGEVRYLKILWWKSWKEGPLKAGKG